MTTLTIAEFCKSKSFTTFTPVVRTNTNGYPFLTFIDDKNVAENVYFSKSAGANLGAGDAVTPAMLKSYQIGLTKNEAGEERIKLISNSSRVDIMSFLG